MANRLADATSPYLLQHADNPVDWHEWGPEALERSRDEDRPILLSIGYAACHWCHVMERESFEDEETARLMNERFVCVKVDREERPDLDAVYMDAVQAMTGHGGWPMTVFLTPEGKPFYAGTYFPPEDRHGMPAFRRVLEAVSDAWANERESVQAQGARVIESIAGGVQVPASREPLEEGLLRSAVDGLGRVFDEELGGFGAAPKFPQPMTIGFLLRMHARGVEGALEMATRTLDAMAAGGIQDRVGGGFHRYSTDREWRVPHFEKMLYDNAQLALVYARAFQVTGREGYALVARDTLDYLLRDLRLPGGGFASSEDADSATPDGDMREGAFYVWDWKELVRLVGEEAAEALGGSPDGNWGGETGEDPSIVLVDAFARVGDVLSFYQERAAREAYLGTARERLSAARAERPRPARDDKVLAGWNGLAIEALAVTGRALGESGYVDAAVEAAGFVLSELRREDGRLLRAWRDGTTSGPAYAEDHAMLAAACLALYEATFETRWFAEARGLADELLRLFEDRDRGGFYQTGSDAESLVVRPKELFDNAVPSGSSVAAVTLQRIALMTGESRYESAAVGSLRVVRDLLPRAPSMFGTVLGALDLYLSPAREIAIVGSAQERRPLEEEVWRRFLPNVVMAGAGPEDVARAAREVPLLEGKTLVEGRAAAYVCERFACRAPVTDPAGLAAQLSAGS